jgi:hypothetical protein
MTVENKGLETQSEVDADGFLLEAGAEESDEVNEEPILSWWRSVAPINLVRSKRHVLANVLAVESKPFLESRILNNAVEMLDPDLCLRIATTLSNRPGVDDNVACSWLLLSAGGGNPVAAAMLATRLLVAQNARDFDLNVTVEHLAPTMANLAQKWIQKSLGSKATLGDVASLYSHQKSKVFQSNTADVVAPAGAKAIEPEDRAAITIVHDIGETSSREGREISRIYRNLTEPMPLAETKCSSRELKASLQAEFPWMQTAIDALVSDIALRESVGSNRAKFQPTVLVGPPGSSKTRFSRRLAELSGVPFALTNIAGATDDRMLRGTARGWNSAQPAFPVLAIHRSETANPLLLLDEIDKVRGDGRNGNVHDTLLGLLETETSQCWMDECLLAPCDLSHISWVMTANSVEGLHPALRSRIRVINVTPPPASAFPAIFKGVLVDIAKELDVEPFALQEISEAAKDLLLADFTRTRDTRRLKRAMRAALSAMAEATPEPRRLN